MSNNDSGIFGLFLGSGVAAYFIILVTLPFYLLYRYGAMVASFTSAVFASGLYGLLMGVAAYFIILVTLPFYLLYRYGAMVASFISAVFASGLYGLLMLEKSAGMFDNSSCEPSCDMVHFVNDHNWLLMFVLPAWCLFAACAALEYYRVMPSMLRGHASPFN
jgi:hypothetical protein